MKKLGLKVRNKWSIAGALMLLVSATAYGVCDFSIKVALGITLVQGPLLLWFGEGLIKKQKKKELSYPHFSFSMLTITVVVLVMYLFGQAAYTTGESYIYWVSHLRTTSSKSIDYEMGTLILSHYLIVIWIYHKEIWRLIRADICRCLPSLWSILLGIGFMIYSREGFNHTDRTISLLIGSGLMVIYLVYKTFVSKDQSVTYHIKPKAYLTNFMGCVLGIGIIGICLPQWQELPGTRWIRSIVSSIGGKANLYERIPYITRLNSDIPISDAILFEVSAMEPLYLREIAYSEYLDGTWHIPESESSYESYMNFDTHYLDAEYIQLDNLLDEIAFQNSQDASIFPEYAKMASYEASIVRKKAYKVLQNPINKINYFTVNSFFGIDDQEAKSIYYYQDFNNYYFHSENLVEPSNYKVDYYDRVPKIGSREYVFLKSINGATWENIYRRVAQNRSKYSLYDEELIDNIHFYSPLIQYRKAKEEYLQVPEELRQQLSTFTRQLTVAQKSDWGSAMLICNFLEDNYAYRLQNKKVEGERVLNFLFEEKEGICQDFATSMVLMCRSIGIPAKYVTGYYASEKNKESGNYIVREKDAHAFVEVYIAGYGWMSFDPTPSSRIEEIKEEGALGLSLQSFMRLITLGSGILIIILLSRGSLSYFEEKWWLVTFRITKPRKQLEKLMIRQEIWLEKSGFPREDYETLSQYAQRLKQVGIDLTISVKLYEAQKYGGLQPNKDDMQGAYRAYKVLKVVLKRLK